MTTCPNCGTEIKTNQVYGCTRKVTKNRFTGNKMNLFERKIATKFSGAEQDYKEFLEKHSGKEIKTTQANDLLGWNSLGDLARTFLDWSICTGTLEKIEFNPNKGGHTWAKLEEFEPCPHRVQKKRNNGEIIYICNCDHWVKLGEKQHSQDDV